MMPKDKTVAQLDRMINRADARVILYREYALRFPASAHQFEKNIQSEYEMIASFERKKQELLERTAQKVTPHES